jgi:hypothetical protein
VSAIGQYQFRVSAPKQETFAWLHGRAEKSGEIIDAAESRFIVRWRGGVVAAAVAPVTMEFAVRGQYEGLSLVTVNVEAPASESLALIEDFAGPLGDRMAGLGARPAGFFDPPLTQRDKLEIAAWVVLFTSLLTVAAATRRLPADDVRMTGAQLTRLLAPFVGAAVVAGAAGGLLVRRRGRWYEPLAGGLLVGCLVSYVVFDVWFNSIASDAECAAHPCDIQAGFGAAFFALPEAAILLCGVVFGRVVAAAASLARRGVRRSSVARR